MHRTAVFRRLFWNVLFQNFSGREFFFLSWLFFTENLGGPDAIHSVNIVLMFCTEAPYEPVRRSFRSCASAPSSEGGARQHQGNEFGLPARTATAIPNGKGGGDLEQLPDTGRIRGLPYLFRASRGSQKKWRRPKAPPYWLRLPRSRHSNRLRSNGVGALGAQTAGSR